MRIVVADDEPSMRTFLEAALVEFGHEVILACDGQEALRAVKAQTPDLLISDIHMPRLDGMALIRALDDVEPRPAIILITGFAEMNSAMEALRLGVYDYLLKPLRVADIGRRLARLERERELETACEAERQARVRAETVRQMVVTLSHEISNPLTNVLGNVVYLLDCHETGEEPVDYEDALRKMQGGCQRMAAILRRLKEIETVRSTTYIPGTEMIDVWSGEGAGRAPDGEAD